MHVSVFSFICVFKTFRTCYTHELSMHTTTCDLSDSKLDYAKCYLLLYDIIIHIVICVELCHQDNVILTVRIVYNALNIH